MQQQTHNTTTISITDGVVKGFVRYWRLEEPEKNQQKEMVFLHFGKMGIYSWIAAVEVLINHCLANNVSLETIANEFIGISGGEQVWVDGKLQLSIIDSVGQVLQEIVLRNKA